jgi:hypothetical protein
MPRETDGLMAIYTKLGKKLDNSAIRIDGDCYVGDKVIQVRAVVEGEHVPRLFYVTDLIADRGQREIDDVIKAFLKTR